MGKEERIRAITKLYYSNQGVQKALLKFALDREVIPRYFEGFGKRPDTLVYMDDIMGLVNKGATSFHASEEIWLDPLKIDSDSGVEGMNSLRKGWDLLIDVDSPFLDCSKVATRLIISALKQHGVTKYGLKYSGSKGFHICVSGKAFPSEYGGEMAKDMFPKWPRAICQYLMNYIRRDYNVEVGKLLSKEQIVKRTKLTSDDFDRVYCSICNQRAIKGTIIKLACPICGTEIDRRNAKLTKRRLKCLNSDCAGVLEVVGERNYQYCQSCKDPESDTLNLSSDKYPESFKEIEGIPAEDIASADLVLVAPRHLFRMPYSLHEKTGLASVVMDIDELENFKPSDADALKVKIKEYYPDNILGEARGLLAAALDWRKTQVGNEEREVKKKYSEYKEVDLSGVTEEDFPAPIKKLLLGLEEGKKRGLFILLTFLRSCGFNADYVNARVREWNMKNKPPLKEGYVKSQIDWNLRQRKKILPPNYENEAFYRDLGLIAPGEKMDVKNPIVSVMRKIKGRESYK
jgi:hypothetical protein